MINLKIDKICICTNCGKENKLQTAKWNYLLDHLVCERCGSLVHFPEQKCNCKEIEEYRQKSQKEYEEQTEYLLKHKSILPKEEFDLLWKLHIISR